MIIQDFFVIRHGQTQTHKGLIYGQTDVPVLPMDEKQLDHLSSRLPEKSRWLTSTRQRTIQTAQALQKYQNTPQPIEHLAEFDEQNFGQWEGKTWNELSLDSHHDFWKAPQTHCPPGGESFHQMCQRVQKGASKLICYSPPPQPIVLIAHHGTLRALVHMALSLESHGALNCQFSPLRLSHFQYLHHPNHGGWRIECLNSP